MKSSFLKRPNVYVILNMVVLRYVISVLAILFFIQQSKSQTIAVRPPGSASDGFTISTLAHLRWLSEGDGTLEVINTDRRKWNYVLAANIDAAETREWNVGDHDSNDETPDVPMGFKPIAYSQSNLPFTGSIDGQGFEISNLYINNSAHAGLFSDVKTEADIQNVFLRNVDLTGNAGGGLIVWLKQGNIRNCHITGQINTKWHNTGGLIGDVSVEDNASILIEKCTSACIVNTEQSPVITSSGGLIGSIYTGGSPNTSLDDYGYVWVKECFSTGDVIGNESSDKTGGFIGWAADSVFFENCESRGEVTGATNCGGFIGSSIGKKGVRYENCISRGWVTARNSKGEGDLKVGGFAGTISYNTQINNCGIKYPMKVTADGYGEVGGFVGFLDGGNESCNIRIINTIVRANISGKRFLGGFIGNSNTRGGEIFIKNCIAYGGVDASGDYIGGFVGSSSNLIFNKCVAYGDVESPDGELIGGFSGKSSSDNILSCYALGKATGHTRVGGFAGMISCAVSYADNHALGNSVNAYTKAGGFAGEFYCSVNQELHGCTSKSIVIADGEHIGGLVGLCTGDIIDCHAEGAVVGQSNYVGGLVGNHSKGKTEYCSATGFVNGNNYVGGLIGSGNGQISLCYATGMVSGYYSVGGLVGRYGKTDNSFATGLIICKGENGGGLKGFPGTAKHVYSIGPVNGGSENVGGVLGRGWNSNSESNYYDVTINSAFQGTGDGYQLNENTGLTTPQFAFEQNFTNWNFDVIWEIATISSIDPFARPYLKWMLAERSGSTPFSVIRVENQMVEPVVAKKENLIQFYMPFDTDISNLALDFTLPTDAYLKINDSIQVSGVTKNDFTENVTGYVYLSDNQLKNASVEEDSTQIWIFDIRNDFHRFSLQASEGGIILGDTLQMVQNDSSSTAVIAHAKEGYKFSSWKNSSGQILSEDSVLIVENVETSMSLIATFDAGSTFVLSNISKGGLVIYPIPAKNFISLVGLAPGEHIKLFNLEGKMMYEGISEYDYYKIDLSGFKPGFYFLKHRGQTYKIVLSP